jgi:hypothetical protein
VVSFTLLPLYIWENISQYPFHVGSWVGPRASLSGGGRFLKVGNRRLQRVELDGKIVMLGVFQNIGQGQLANELNLFSVLEVCRDACPSSSFCNIQDVVLCLMKRVANCLLEVGGEESQQLVEIGIIVTYMLIELEAKREIIVECIGIIICILHMRSQLVQHVLLAFESKKRDAVSGFKFGLHEVNSALGKCNIETVLEVLKSACCMCFIQTEQYAKCVTCLEDFEDGEIKFQFIHNYMKGMCIRFKD